MPNPRLGCGVVLLSASRPLASASAGRTAPSAAEAAAAAQWDGKAEVAFRSLYRSPPLSSSLVRATFPSLFDLFPPGSCLLPVRQRTSLSTTRDRRRGRRGQ